MDRSEAVRAGDRGRKVGGQLVPLAVRLIAHMKDTEDPGEVFALGEMVRGVVDFATFVTQPYSHEALKWETAGEVWANLLARYPRMNELAPTEVEIVTLTVSVGVIQGLMEKDRD